MSISGGQLMKIFFLPAQTVNPLMAVPIRRVMKWIAGEIVPPVESVSGPDGLSRAHRQN